MQVILFTWDIRVSCSLELTSLLIDGTQGLAFLTTLTAKFDTPNTREAFVLGTMESAHFKLLLGDNEGTKEAMDQCGKILDLLDSVDLVVHASFYRVSGDYYKVRFSFYCPQDMPVELTRRL